MFSLVLSLPLSLFNCEQFHSLRTYRTSESNIEENCMLDKSKSIVQGTKSTLNCVFTTELNYRVPESKQCTYAFSVYP